MCVSCYGQLGCAQIVSLETGHDGDTGEHETVA